MSRAHQTKPLSRATPTKDRASHPTRQASQLEQEGVKSHMVYIYKGVCVCINIYVYKDYIRDI